MKKELTNDELLSLNGALTNVALKGIGNVRFKYAVVRNSKLIADAVETINDMRKPDEKFTAYQKDLFDNALKHCESNNGQLVLYTNDSYTTKIPKGTTQGIPKPKAKEAEAYKDANEKLKTKYKKAIVDNEKKLKEFNEALTLKVKVDTYDINLSDAESAEDLDYQTLLALSIVINEKK